MARTINFLICGAQKSGTSALHQYLSQHPQIFLPAIKELHLFDQDHADWSDAGIDVVSSEYAVIAAEQTALENLSQDLAQRIVTRVALALTRARARDAWLASAVACAMATRAMGRARAVARATMDRALGARCADGTAVPREDARGFEVAERLSATDAWYQVVCARGGGRGRVDVLGGTRCSGEMARVVMATARRCFEDG